MIRNGKVYGDSLHLRIPHSLKMELRAMADNSGMSLSQFVLTQLMMIDDRPE